LNQPAQQPVAALFGTLKILSSLVSKTEKFQLHFALDGYPQHRYALLPDYKKGRGKNMTEETESLFPILKEEVQQALQYVPSSWYYNPKYEADDIIATIVDNLELEKKDEVWIVSSDKDLWGLVSKQVSCVGIKSEKTTPEAVQETLGVGPEKVALYKSFFGDASDKIPRVPRVRSVPLLEAIIKSANVLEFYEKLEQGQFTGFSANELTRLKEFQEQAKINYEVATLCRLDCDLGVAWYVSKKDCLKDLLRERNCPSLISEVDVFYSRRKGVEDHG
jgi:DNA polymerase-1